MKFGLFYELSVPRPWTRESERTVYDNALEQVRLADELGFDQVWAVEHHFLEEYSSSRASSGRCRDGRSCRRCTSARTPRCGWR
jgi:alkanesulfonate monooxygenase SsuD/methylene tetrahydromethanopterin reductase-like flavin-dependent oxidoreductase (luciferase family)